MIQDKYLLVIMIPYYIDEENRRSTDALWNKDIIKHLVQISNLTLAAPARYEAPPDKFVPIDPAMFEGTLSYLELPPCNTTISALFSIPTATLKLWRAIGETDIVHVNVGGWPISFGWIAAPIAKLRGKFVLTNIESIGRRLGVNDLLTSSVGRTPCSAVHILAASVDVLGRVGFSPGFYLMNTITMSPREETDPRRSGARWPDVGGGVERGPGGKRAFRFRDFRAEW